MISCIRRESENMRWNFTAGSDRYVARQFYSFGWGYTTNSSFQVNTEGQVDIQADKEKYMVGDKAHILFKAPFNGRLLVTIECDNVIEYRYLNTDKKSRGAWFTCKRKLYTKRIHHGYFVPRIGWRIYSFNCWSRIPSIDCSTRWKQITCQYCSCRKSRSKTKQIIKVKNSAETGYRSYTCGSGWRNSRSEKLPDTWSAQFLYQKESLVGKCIWCVSESSARPETQQINSGGDADSKFDMSKRVNPMNNKRVKLVSLWSGILHTNAAGETEYTVDIPQFSGDLRIMACVYKDKSFGSADKHMKVANPVWLSVYASVPFSERYFCECRWLLPIPPPMQRKRLQLLQ